MFARIMGIVSPSIFLSSSIVWGLSTGHPVAVVLSIALGASAAFMSLWLRACFVRAIFRFSYCNSCRLLGESSLMRLLCSFLCAPFW